MASGGSLIAVTPPGIEPRTYFLACQVSARFLVRRPGCHCFVFENLARFFSIEVLLNLLSNDLLRRTPPQFGLRLDAIFQRHIDIYRRRHDPFSGSIENLARQQYSEHWPHFP